MACRDWRKEVPRVSVTDGSIDLKRPRGHQKLVLFRAVEPIEVEIHDTDESLVVPESFLSDGSSVPGPLWGLLEAEPGDLLLPGFVHDYAYRKGAKIRRANGRKRAIGREEADLLHIAVCRRLRVSRSDQDKIYLALRTGGRFPFRDKEVDWDGKG